MYHIVAGNVQSHAASEHLIQLLQAALLLILWSKRWQAAPCTFIAADNLIRWMLSFSPFGHVSRELSQGVPSLEENDLVHLAMAEEDMPML